MRTVAASVAGGPHKVESLSPHRFRCPLLSAHLRAQGSRIPAGGLSLVCQVFFPLRSELPPVLTDQFFTTPRGAANPVVAQSLSPRTLLEFDCSFTCPPWSLRMRARACLCA